MRIPDWLKPGGGLPGAMRTTLLTLLAVVAVGIALQYTGLYQTGETVTASLTVGARKGDAVPLTVTARYTNPDDEGLLLTAEGPCDVFRWMLLTSGGDFVQGEYRNKESCPQVHVEQWVQPEHYLEQSYELAIETDRLKRGESYVLHMRYWGTDLRKEVPALIE